MQTVDPGRDSSSDRLNQNVAAGLGRIPSGLFVITWRSEAADRGMLASWVMQAAFDPPSISIAVENTRDLLPHLQEGGSCVVHVLAAADRGLLGRFAKTSSNGQDPFEGLSVARGDSGALVLQDAAVALECRATASCVAGDHTIVTVAVTAAPVVKAAADPAVHLRKNGLRY
jgi:flavin reductase (DIM6/NTAB) family NADH-FMN oxidoreductase RutF